MHWRYHFQGCYSPHIGILRCLSCSHSLYIVNCFLSSEKRILELIVVLTGDPFLVHDIAGTGFPSALQDKVTFSPSGSASG